MSKQKNPSWMFLAYLLFAMGSPVVKLLVERGGEFGLAHPHAISFCNVLFVGNFCAGILVALTYGPRQLWQGLKQQKQRLALLLSVLLATAYPALLFTALSTTTVTNLVLLSRAEAVFYAIFAAVFLGVQFPKKQTLGFAFMGCGILALVMLANNFHLMKGDGLVLIAGVLFTLDTQLSRKLLESMRPHELTFLRTFTSALVFFIIALYAYGPEHFADAFQGELWLVMVVYALVIVVGANLIYYKNLPLCSLDYLTKLALASPAMSIGFALLFLGERPDMLQVTAGFVILVGMLISSTGLERFGMTPEAGLAAK